MRFLRLEDDGDFSLTEYVGSDIPQYAILSHTWGADHEEVTFKDVTEGTGKNKAGYRKLAFCGEQAAKDGLQIFWVDTCCIDKSSSAELSEAINSMFRWYHDAVKCYVYLSDVLVGGSMESEISSQRTWKPDFQHSRWFTRGWTLQELLAPTSVEFFSVEGERLGDRISLLQEIHDTTGISIQALQGSPLSQFSVDERMSWQERRETKREEDAAYSLLGIFDIHIPLLYGEGRTKAFVRLQKELEQPLRDESSALTRAPFRVRKEVSSEETGFLTPKRNPKLSWIGVNDTKHYAYLRDEMVSSLMGRICNLDIVEDSLGLTYVNAIRHVIAHNDEHRDIDVSQDRRDVVAKAIGSWAFSAHEFTDDELLYSALLMLKHALQMPELEQWGMADGDLIIFLLASRAAYNDFVLYHNFRRVIDVLQALFHSLVQIGTLLPYPSGSAETEPTPKSLIAQLLKPLDALTLLISAIGHDVGHPGVNNALLVALNAPLAQLYNDRSVLECFHCAAYSQILRRYWPKAFADSIMRKLMINSILATDT